MRSKKPINGAFRTVWPWERATYIAHLLRLDPTSRRARFHGAINEAAIRDHVDKAFGGGTHVIGWFLEGAIRGAAEIALFKGEAGMEAEAAFEVETAYRRLGAGAELMRRAALSARNREATALHISTEIDNTAMMRLATAYGAVFRFSDRDAEGVLRQRPRTTYSLALESWEEDNGLRRWRWGMAAARMRRMVGRFMPPAIGTTPSAG